MVVEGLSLSLKLGSEQSPPRRMQLTNLGTPFVPESGRDQWDQYRKNLKLLKCLPPLPQVRLDTAEARGVVAEGLFLSLKLNALIVGLG